MIIQEIHLTVGTLVVTNDLRAVQYDSGRALRMILDDFALTSDMLGVLDFRRPDGTFYEADATLELSTNSFYVSGELMQQAYTRAGVVQLQLSVLKGTKTLTTYTFEIYVERDVVGEEIEQSVYELSDAYALANEARNLTNIALSNANSAVVTAGQAVATANDAVEAANGAVATAEEVQAWFEEASTTMAEIDEFMDDNAAIIAAAEADSQEALTTATAARTAAEAAQAAAEAAAASASTDVSNRVLKSGDTMTGVLTNNLGVATSFGRGGRIIPLPYKTRGDFGFDSSTPNIYSEHFKALVLYLCDTFPTAPAECTTWIGETSPSSIWKTIISIYDVTLRDSTTNLPRYSHGVAFPWNGVTVYTFGTNDYVWYFRETVAKADLAYAADKLSGFSSGGSASTISWGNQIGTPLYHAATSTNGAWAFRNDNPSYGKVSMLLDGTVYVNEGQNKVIDSSGGELTGNLVFSGSDLQNVIYFKNNVVTDPVIRAWHKTDYTYGHGILIGGGGATLIGGGESATMMYNGLIAGGYGAESEIMCIGNDGNVSVYTNLQSAWADRKTFTFRSDGVLETPYKVYVNYDKSRTGEVSFDLFHSSGRRLEMYLNDTDSGLWAADSDGSGNPANGRKFLIVNKDNNKKIQLRGGVASSWIAARDYAIAYNSEGTGNTGSLFPVAAMKGYSGAWAIGAIGTDNRLTFSWTSDTDYANSTNAANVINIYPGGRITARADSASALNNTYSASTRPTSANVQYGDGTLRYFLSTSSMSTGKPGYEGSIIHLSWDNMGAWDAQLFIPHGVGAGASPKYRWETGTNNTWTDWATILASQGWNNSNTDGYIRFSGTGIQIAWKLVTFSPTWTVLGGVGGLQFGVSAASYSIGAWKAAFSAEPRVAISIVTGSKGTSNTNNRILGVAGDGRPGTANGGTVCFTAMGPALGANAFTITLSVIAIGPYT